MKNFKNIFACILVFTLLNTLFTGCNIGSNSNSTYLIATDTTFAPFEFEENGKMVGIDMDILEAVAKDQNFHYEVKALGFNAAITALESKQVDGVIAGMSITDSRKEKYDFSTPYYEAGVVMAVKNTTPNVNNFEDLKDQTIAVKTGTQGADFAESIQNEYGFKIKYFEESSAMYDEVITENSIACFEDYPVVAYGITQGLGLRVVTEQENKTSFGFAVNKGVNTELLDMFNKGLENIKTDGTYQNILDKYTSDTE